jgi:hypothetical protein
MPICPGCKTEQKKRINDACPKCGTEVSVYKGRWYRTELGSPSVAMLTHLETRASKALSLKNGSKVVYRIPKKGALYVRELVSAERLLNLVDGDYDLAVDAIDILFFDKQFNWKIYTSLLYIDKDFLVAKAIAEANREKRKEQEEKARKTIALIVDKEDVFA